MMTGDNVLFLNWLLGSSKGEKTFNPHPQNTIVRRRISEEDFGGEPPSNLYGSPPPGGIRQA